MCLVGLACVLGCRVRQRVPGVCPMCPCVPCMPSFIATSACSRAERRDIAAGAPAAGFSSLPHARAKTRWAFLNPARGCVRKRGSAGIPLQCPNLLGAAKWGAGGANGRKGCNDSKVFFWGGGAVAPPSLGPRLCQHVAQKTSFRAPKYHPNPASGGPIPCKNQLRFPSPSPLPTC